MYLFLLFFVFITKIRRLLLDIKQIRSLFQENVRLIFNEKHNVSYFNDVLYFLEFYVDSAARIIQNNIIDINKY